MDHSIIESILQVWYISLSRELELICTTKCQILACWLKVRSAINIQGLVCQDKECIWPPKSGENQLQTNQLEVKLQSDKVLKLIHVLSLKQAFWPLWQFAYTCTPSGAVAPILAFVFGLDINDIYLFMFDPVAKTRLTCQITGAAECWISCCVEFY